MKSLLIPLAALAPLAAPVPQDERMDDPAQLIGLTMFVPEHGSASELIGYASEMVPSHFQAFAGPQRGMNLERLLLIRSAIGIQGTEVDRATIRGILAELDTNVGALEDGRAAFVPEDDPEPESHALRLKTMSPDAALRLIQGLGLPLDSHVVEETGTLVLTGDPELTQAALQLIDAADAPLPQMTLHCEIIEAVDVGSVSAGQEVSAEVAQALSAVAPGKAFQRKGRVMVRSSVGGQRFVEVSTELPNKDGRASDPPPRMTLEALPAGWDPETGTVTLKDCRVKLEIPTFHTVQAPPNLTPNHSLAKAAALQRSFEGYRSQGLGADLSLRAGETTVIGSLGGTPHFVAMHFTVN